MSIRPIRNETDYDNALDRVDELMDLNPVMHTLQSDELEVLVLLIEKYEEKAWAISEPDLIEAIKIRMEEMQLIYQKEPIIFSKAFLSNSSLISCKSLSYFNSPLK